MSNATDGNETRNESDELRARALELLLGGTRPAEVARQLGVDRTTVYRWRTSPAFAARYRAALDERAADAAVRVDAAASAALELLEDVIEDPSHGVAVRVRAAEVVLKHAAMVRPPPVPPTDADTGAQLVRLLEEPPGELLRALSQAWPKLYPAVRDFMEAKNDGCEHE